MNASTKLGIVLIVIFATCLLALLIELIYVFWRKRSFRQRIVVSGSTHFVDSEFSNSPFYAAPSKELLYFFCWKNQPARVEPSPGVVSTTPTEAATAADSEAAAAEEDEDELAKWQAVYGQSRLLYTIKEEEREGADSVENSADQSEAKSEKRVCLRDCFSGGAEMADDVSLVVDVEEEATPFSTPCASPSYFTPSPSPDREVAILILPPGNDDVISPRSDVSTERKVGFLSLRIEG
ncbi:uncharacterized protein LOC111310579 [Durio zibethinus]|uniref:Uncharacterized protein LOC111310579 n=1 Tax=Durio zibethinus TaxID=66656 RepID=A0A6P6ALR4_DURZI|nr:uncharacterized protein LOC111310579 [Durio zibethinus]